MEEDKKLYRLFLDGDKEAFETLTLKYRSSITYFATKFVKNIEDAEDIFQETILYIFEHKEYYKFDYPFKTYIFVVAKSKALDYLKKKKIVENLDEKEYASLENLEDIVFARTELSKVREIIKELPKEYQMVIYLTQVEDLSYKEAAKLMSKSETQIKLLLYRARKKLKEYTKVVGANNVQYAVIDKMFNKDNILSKQILLLRILIMIIILMMLMSGFIYAGIIIYQNYVNQNYVKATTSTNTNYRDNPEYKYSQDMQGSNELSYKRITTYEQYQEDLKKWPDLVEMTEEDFKGNFVIVIAGENYHTTGLEVEDIATDETNLVIDLKQKDKYDETSVLTIKLSREYERENIILRNNPIKPVAPNDIMKIEDIPAGYSIEEAIADGCLVIKDHKENNGREVLSANKSAMDEFVEKCNNGEDAFIRIYEYNIIDNADVRDVQCKNGKISMCNKNVTQEGAVVGSYKSGYKIDIYESENYKSYTLVDEIGNKRLICGIEF